MRVCHMMPLLQTQISRLPYPYVSMCIDHYRDQEYQGRYTEHVGLR